MADNADGGGGGGRMSPYLPYWYEELRDMVASDSHEKIRNHAAEWRRIGNAMQTFAAMVHEELGLLDEVYSSREGSPALMRRLSGDVQEMGETAVKLIHNAQVLDSAADALEAAQREMTAIQPEDGRPVWRDNSPHTDGLTNQARPIVERLANAYDTATNSLAFGEISSVLPDAPGSDDHTGGLSGQTPTASPYGSWPAVRGAGGPGPSGKRSVTAPARGGSGPAPDSQSRVSSGSDRPTARATGTTGATGEAHTHSGSGRRLQVPGARSGEPLGGSRIPAARGGTLGRLQSGGTSPPGQAGSGGPASPSGRPGGAPPGGGPGGPGGGSRVPPGGVLGHGAGGDSDGDRRGRRLTWYERIEDEFVDKRAANPPGGTIGGNRATATPVDPGPTVIGSQRHRPAEEHEKRKWELPDAAPIPEGFPDKVENGSFQQKDGTRFQVRGRNRGA